MYKRQVDSFKNGLYELQRPGQVVIQAAMADFIEEGHFTSHIRRLKQTYSERRRLLQASLAPIEQVGARLSPVDSGLHLVVTFEAFVDDVKVAELAAEQGLRVYPLSNYGLGEHREKGLIIGYAYAATENISRYGHVLALSLIHISLVGDSKPAIILNNVDLPQPEPPRSAKISPFITVSETSSTAFTVPS